MSKVTKTQLQKMVDTAEDCQIAYEEMADTMAEWEDADTDTKEDIREQIAGFIRDLEDAAGKLRELYEKADW